MNTSFPAGQTVDINGMQIYFEIVGQGEPLLLLHGFRGSSQDWEPFRHDLVGEYQLIIPDLRGHGRSTNPSMDFTHRQAALDVYALLDHLHIERFKAIGISGGGNILLHIATQQPARVKAMVLISAASYYTGQARKLMQQLLVDSQSDEEWQSMRQRHQLGDEQIRTLLKQGEAIKNTYDDMNFTPPYLSTITARTLLVYGDGDELVPVQIALEMFTAIPHTYLWIIPNAGHGAIFNSQDEPWGVQPFIAAVLLFLRGEWERKKLQVLYEQDQEDRRGFKQLDQEQIQQMLQQDRARRQWVERLLENDVLQTPEDYFHAAMIFQHGETLAHFWKAHELALRGAELGHPTCRWLAAAAYDRWLMNQGKPQKYGTQYNSREGRWVLYEVDPTTTDAEREEWNVPSLAESLQREEEMNQTMPPSH